LSRPDPRIAEAAFCAAVVERTISAFGRLDILVSNAAHRNRKPSIEDVNYHSLSSKQYKIVDVRGPREARRRLEAGRRTKQKQ